MIWNVIIWYAMIYDMIWYDMKCNYMICYDIWYDMIWYERIRYNMICYKWNMKWYEMKRKDIWNERKYNI